MIETKRLAIRKIRETEVNMIALYKILSDETVNKYLPWYPVKNIEETKKFYKAKINLNGKKIMGIIL
ncbi:hypothetical protein IGJ55_002354 [Enterococcus sp. AZ170]|uniref:hypothetical protein n=1 Tax=Enterococcus TaxID=1350 RepID=UPI001F5D0384|nr:hypothetical protein [Enterococcus ureilyticus]